MSTESLEVEYKRLYAELKGISPKVSTYKVIEKRLNEIKAQMTGGVANMGKFLGRKDNRFVKVKKGKSTVPFSGKIIEEKKTICNWEGCGKPRCSMGKNRLRSMCRPHWKAKKK